MDNLLDRKIKECIAKVQFVSITLKGCQINYIGIITKYDEEYITLGLTHENKNREIIASVKDIVVFAMMHPTEINGEMRNYRNEKKYNTLCYN